MRHLKMAVMTGAFLLAATIVGCASGPEFTKSSEKSTSAIRGAEEVGASKVPNAALHLQLAKEELNRAKELDTKGKKEEAVSMLSRAEADAELAVALSHEEKEKTEAAQAVERVRKLREDNRSSPERSQP
ncbi:MAG: DUF4398 domain-containing protein [Nitrospirae bacterium]|nr:DUF4398 domain-containing protein [Candidatus Manganitrophaceae bacterium]